MLHFLDQTLERLLTERGNLERSAIDIAFDLPGAEWSSRLARPTINCWCYDLRENVKMRNMDMQITKGDRRAIMKLPPRRVDFTYLVTAWARKPEDEHLLLWRALYALSKSTVLLPEECEGDLKYQPYEIPITVAQPGETGVNLSDLWSVLQNDMHLGFNVLVTLALDTEREFDAPLVLEARIGIGQADEPPSQTMTALDRELIQRAKSADNRPNDGSAGSTSSQG